MSKTEPLPSQELGLGEGTYHQTGLLGNWSAERRELAENMDRLPPHSPTHAHSPRLRWRMAPKRVSGGGAETQVARL